MAEKPLYNAFAVETFERDGKDETRWCQIGAAWKHKKGDGFTIQLQALPINGSIVLRAPKEEKDPKENQEPQREYSGRR